jgi:putative chitinase
MPIFENQLRRLSPILDDERAAAELVALNETLERFEINNINRVQFFLAQVLWESANLFYTHEIWAPTPAQRKYEFSEKLGNTIAGDGHKFKGRGYIQLTGRFNYFDASTYFQQDFICDPDKASELPWRWLIAGWFWKKYGCNEAADAGSLAAFKKVTKIINGGYTHLAQREKKLAKVKSIIKSL